MIHTFNSEKHLLPGLILPVTCTCIKEASKSILISPIGFSENEIDQLKTSGGVTDIIAPNLIHHLYVQKAKAEFPQAHIWGVKGFQEKRPDIRWDRMISKADWPFTEFLDILEVKGASKLNEVVFLHKKTRTLVVTDLCFNLQNPKGFMAPILLNLLGTYKKFNVSRFILRSIDDKESFKSSMKELMTWDFDQIIMSHGNPIRRDGKEKLRKALLGRGLLDA